MTLAYTVVYYNIDEVENSEVVGIYTKENDAIEAVIRSAHYSENEDGELLQYLRKTDDYASMEELKQIVIEKREIVDSDLFRIETVNIF